MDINLFTAQAKSEFLKGMQVVPVNQLPVDKFVTWVPSTARIETYLWMTPSPGISEYVGRRRLAKLDQAKLLIENKEFDGSISVPVRDIEDDLVGGYPLRFNELGVKAARFPERWIYQKLANGANVNTIDNTNYFATAHNWGGGNSTLPSPFTGGLNDLTYTSANTSDGVTAKSVFMMANPGSGPIKPMLYQNRKPPKIGTDAGTPASMKAKQADYWVDLEAEALFGYWWDAVIVNWVNTPNLTDVFTVIDQVIKQFLSFYLPAALPSDPNMYVHQGIDMNSKLGTVVVSNSLARLFAHALGEERFGVSVAGSTSGLTNNIFFGSWDLLASGYMI
jgi:phage major head subunit gpT-like protein